MEKTKKINTSVCVTGLGYIGLPTALLLASKGFSVSGADLNPDVLERLSKPKLPKQKEKGLEELFERAKKHGNLSVSSTPTEADIHIITVPTPFKEGFLPDISYVEKAAENIAKVLKKGNLIINESTSPVGTTKKIAKLIKNLRPDLDGTLFFAYCPERVIPGNILYELENNDRAIGGIDEASSQKAVAFYKHFVKGELHIANADTAELCKLAENAYRDVSIAFANELSMICDKAGINTEKLIYLANKHPRVKILKPGTGVGGHCVATDPYFIISAFKEEAKLIAKARQVNNQKTDWCTEKIFSEINDFAKREGRKPIVALMGLSFKPDVDDLRDSPALKIAERLAENYDKDLLFISEPNLKEHKRFMLSDCETACSKADIIAFSVAHQEFKNLDIEQNKIILDFCGVFSDRNLENKL